MAQRKLLTSGNAFVRTDGRWTGVVWYMDEHGERKRKSFSGTTKAEVNRKMTNYVAAFDKMVIESDESKKTLEESMMNWLKVFKFPSVERGSYDRLECTAKHQVYPLLGSKVVGYITSADIRRLLNHWMNKGYAWGISSKIVEKKKMRKAPRLPAPSNQVAVILFSVFCSPHKESRKSIRSATSPVSDVCSPAPPCYPP